jgi:hypothetical protein
MARTRKMKGSFCEKQKSPRSAFDGRSFRWKHSGKSWVLVGCPKGRWDARKARCKVGTRAHKILAASPKGRRCRVGKRITK